MRLQDRNLIDGLLLLDLWRFHLGEGLRLRQPERLRSVADSIALAAPNLDSRARVKALALIERAHAGLRYLDAA